MEIIPPMRERLILLAILRPHKPFDLSVRSLRQGRHGDRPLFVGQTRVRFNDIPLFFDSRF
jgi:hypothetical protein